MVSMEIKEQEQQPSTCKSPDHLFSSPRISFSSDLLDDSNFISINLCPIKTDDSAVGQQKQNTNNKARNHPDFEFLSSNSQTQRDMPTADELFFEGKLLPYWQTHHSEKLKNLTLKEKEISDQQKVKEIEEVEEVVKPDESRMRTWFIDDDPSPRPPKCTVLWKELLRLKTKHRASSLSPSSSSSSSSSSCSLDMSKDKEKSRDSNAGKNVKRAKKGLERTRSASIRIRPMVNVPICAPSGKQSALPPLFPLRKGR